jgi:hypothetical protein
LVVLAVPSVQAQDAPPAPEAVEDHLVVLWTSGEKDVFTKVVYPYCLNSKKQGWWKQVTLIVWGPSSRLLSVDDELQEAIRELGKAEIRLTACKWCADQYEVSEKLAGLGIDVKYMGQPLTEFLKSSAHVMVF